MIEFAMDARFYKRLATIYRDPQAAAVVLAKRTAKLRKAKGMEPIKLKAVV